MQKSINKTTLAAKFGWDYNFLVRTINKNSKLYNELKESANYNPYQRLLTPLQVEIIYKHLGNPEK